MNPSHLLLAILAVCTSFVSPLLTEAQETIPLGKNYTGKKCLITVSDFAIQVPGAPQEIGDGLREMLQTALFESNYFIVVDRIDSKGISAEQLLSDSFMANPDAILLQGQMDPAEVLIYGTITDLQGGGAGLRVKIPWIPLNLGGTHYEAKTGLNLRVVDAATGKIIATAQTSGSATSNKGSLGTSLSGIDLPVELEMFKNTPLELCIRDSIYRSVIKLCETLPQKYFTH